MVAFLDEDGMACLDEDVMAFLDKSNKDNFYVDIRHILDDCFEYLPLVHPLK